MIILVLVTDISFLYCAAGVSMVGDSDFLYYCFSNPLFRNLYNKYIRYYKYIETFGKIILPSIGFFFWWGVL